MHGRLRHARLQAGYTTARAAIARFGWIASTYRAHENGQNNFRPADAYIYARAYKVSPTWLLVGEYGASALRNDGVERGCASNENVAHEANAHRVASVRAPESHFDLTVGAGTLADLARSGDIVRFSPLADHEALTDGDIVAIEQAGAGDVDVCIRRVFFRDGLTLFAARDIAQAEPVPHARIVGVATWLLRRLAN